MLGVDPQHGGLDWKARLGIVLQSSGEQGNATVREQLTHFAGLYPNPRSVDEVIAAVGLDEKAGTRIRRLSGGQRRRVDVALGIIGTPELLFLDEPTTGFDPEARRQFWDLIRGLKAEGTTILLTTHYLDEAAQLGDRAGDHRRRTLGRARRGRRARWRGSPGADRALGRETAHPASSAPTGRGSSSPS